MDARHPFTPLDRQLLEWLGPSASGARPSMRKLVLLSKADKLSRAEQAALAKAHSEALLFSSVTKQGVEQCRDLLEGWLQQAAEIKSPR
jgi:GTP-binding protein